MNLSLALLCVLAPLPLVAATQLRATRFLTSIAEGLVFYIAIQVGWGALLGVLRLATPAWFVASALVLLVSGGAHYFRLRRSSPSAHELATHLGLLESFSLSLIVVPFATAAWFALTIPITNFDSLAYHLPTLARWVQSQSLAPVEFLGLQQCYPMSMMALALPSAVLGRSDIFVSLLGLLAYPLLGLSTFRLARQLGGSRGAALAAVACLMTAPVLLRAYGNAQPDTMLAALFVFAMAQWISIMSDRGSTGLLTLVLAVGLIPGFKSTGLGYFLLMSLLILASLRGRPILAQRLMSSLRSRSGTAALLLGGFLGGFWYLRATLLCGTPTGIFSLGSFREARESWTAAEVLRTTIAHGFRWSAGQDWLTAWSIVKDTVGFPFLILSAFGLVSILVHRRAGGSRIAPSSERWRPHRITTAALFGCAVLYTFTPFSLDNGGHAYRLSTWSGNGVRYALPFLAIATALIAARLRSVPGSTSIAVALALGGSILGLSNEVRLARTDVLALTVLVGIVAVALSKLRVGRRLGMTILSAAVVLASTTVFLTLPGRDRLWRSAYGSFFQQLQSAIPQGEPVAFHGVERPYPLYGQRWSRKVVGRAYPRSDRFLWSANKNEWERETREWLQDLTSRGVRHLVTRSRDPRPAFDGRATDLYQLLKQDPRWRLVRKSGDTSYLGLFVVDNARPTNPTAESFLADP